MVGDHDSPKSFDLYTTIPSSNTTMMVELSTSDRAMDLTVGMVNGYGSPPVGKESTFWYLPIAEDGRSADVNRARIHMNVSYGASLMKCTIVCRKKKRRTKKKKKKTEGWEEKKKAKTNGVYVLKSVVVVRRMVVSNLGFWVAYTASWLRWCSGSHPVVFAQ